MITKELTLRSGRVIALVMPDLYQLAATDVEIPNQALSDIMDLAVYGGMISTLTGAKDENKRREENRRFLRSQFELAALCCPELTLKGDGALTPRDLTPDDLRAIVAFFQTGGSDGVSAAPGTQPAGDTQPDLSGEAVDHDAE